MRYIDLTFPTPAGNLACDEALLDLCERGEGHEMLRFWESAEPFVVLGYSSRTSDEVNLASCEARGIPVLRRPSGGAAVLQGPGCLSYALALRIRDSGPLKNISETSAFIMERHREALHRVVGSEVGIQGVSDLTLGPLKFSGNAQYRRRRSVLFHGTFLLGLDLELMEELLPVPARQSSYRRGRSHRKFLVNLRVSPSVVKEALRKSWQATEPLVEVPVEKINELVACRYSRRDWSFKF